MISVTKENYINYGSIPVLPKNFPDVIAYPAVFSKISSKDVVELKRSIQSLTGIDFNNYVVGKKPSLYTGEYGVVVFSDYKAQFMNEGNNLVYNCKKGTLLMFRKNFDENWSWIWPSNMVTFFNKSLLLEEIYLSKTLRLKLINIVQTSLNLVKKLPIGEQCMERYTKKTELLGKGDYGNVYKVILDGVPFAVKMSKIKDNAILTPYSRFNSSWFEVLIMREILNPMVKSGMCPNFPLLLESFVCNTCKLTIRDKKISSPCCILVTELATGTLRNYLKDYNPSEADLYSALFQVMVALHGIQISGQIMNFDVKADNVLFYKVKPGGVWEYIIHGKSFYVPNRGYLFVLNDFGISRPMSPSYQFYREEADKTFRLGSRFAIVINGKFSPLKTSYEPTSDGGRIKSSLVTWDNNKTSQGSQFRIDKKTQKVMDCKAVLTKSQKKFLESVGIPTDTLSKNFFLFPEVIPPFEFYNDTQDAIRTFIGGKRTTQRGSHKKYSVVTDKLFKLLQKYDGEGDSMADKYFSTNPSQVLAGYFIESFFKDFKKKPKEKIIGTYRMS